MQVNKHEKRNNSDLGSDTPYDLQQVHVKAPACIRLAYLRIARIIGTKFEIFLKTQNDMTALNISCVVQ